MNKFFKTKLGKDVINVIMIFAGCFLCGISFNIFLVPNNISPAGFSGLCQLISELLAKIGVFINASYLYFVVNGVLMIFAYKIVGKRFAIFTIIGIFAFSFMLEITSYITIEVTAENILQAIYGGVLMGVGIGVVIRFNSSTGGGDLTACIIRKKTQSLSTGQIILTIDMIVITLVAIFKGLESSAYSIIELYISIKATDFVIDGANGVKAFYIFTSKKEQVTKRIFDEIARGATEITAKGMYTHQEKSIILCIVNRISAPRLRRIVKEEDENAFVFSTNVSEVIGNGFTKEQKKLQVPSEIPVQEVEVQENQVDNPQNTSKIA